MPHKNAFQPKDARTVSVTSSDDDDDDFSSLVPRTNRPSRRPSTGTQALADFLNNTSPEEFQRAPPPQPSSHTITGSSFFKRRKNKLNSSNASTSSQTSGSSTASRPAHAAVYLTNHSAPPTYEPIPQKNDSTQAKKASTPTPAPSTSTNQGRSAATTDAQGSAHPSKIRHAQEPRVASTNTSTSISPPTSPVQGTMSPALPNATHSKRRESSIYSGGGSLRRLAGGGSTRNKYQSPFTSMNSQQLTHTQRRSEARGGGLKLMDLFEAEKHPIDAALQQRLDERAQEESAANTAREVVTSKVIEPTPASTRVRHAQTQTVEEAQTGRGQDDTTEHASSSSSSSRETSMEAPPSTGLSAAELKRRIAEERRQQKHLQLAIDTSADQFEVLSGLAYKKLRMLWEEKMRWENAYFDLQEQYPQVSA
ncbi:hypothetical protein BCR43DRAFT_497978 [Syncephalastrum racemosum]|uniref:Uncharacterized protein n=1 Tax=Syncephalastrum racemosum TaxID=13706 RepID=A0A1X2H393_SYNRA|nr:hypothetical protein BCR43DRAFT_497978 [Syncephalastrum racemosum]